MCGGNFLILVQTDTVLLESLSSGSSNLEYVFSILENNHKQVVEKEITLIQVNIAYYLGGLKSELLANVRTTNAFKSDAEGLLC